MVFQHNPILNFGIAYQLVKEILSSPKKWLPQKVTTASVRVDSRQLGVSMKGPKLEWHVLMKQRVGTNIYIVLPPHTSHWKVLIYYNYMTTRFDSLIFEITPLA